MVDHKSVEELNDVTAGRPQTREPPGALPYEDVDLLSLGGTLI